MTNGKNCRVSDGFGALGKLSSGMRILAEVVAVTLGPGGRHVILEHRSGLAPRLSKDGVEIARTMEVAGREEEMGVRLLRDAAISISASVGDGTTTAIVLSAALATRCMAASSHPLNVSEMRYGLAMAGATVLSELAAMARPADQHALQAVARTAVNGDAPLAALLADAYARVGSEGVIKIEMGNAMHDVLDVKLGHRFESLLLASGLPASAGERQLLRPLTLLHDGELDDLQALIPAMEIARAEQRPLLILAGDVSDGVRTAIVRNARENVVDVTVVRAPMFGDTRQECLGDLAALCGGSAFVENGFRTIAALSRDDLGSVDRAVVDAGSAILHGAHGDARERQDRIALLRSEMEGSGRSTASPSGQLDHSDKCQERLQILLGATASLQLGGATDVAIKARMPIAENGRRALLAAASTGVLPGGGVAMLRAALAARSRLSTLQDDARLGAEALLSALQAPFAWVVRNSGHQPEECLDRVLSEADCFHGLDAARGCYGDLHAAGVLDSFLMVRKIVTVATSMAGSLLSTGALVCRGGETALPENFQGTQQVYRKLAAGGAFDS
ncbi:chaperonin GroEL [Solimonas aquatica]|uniref:Chaperonin GroEL n=1 Tax=Solimonas aquatica TaxID=489703 RepID=A0A1H9GPM9_9GAMM|nr:chaperonin GroEL [Solimonas aquatica]SEQ52000.1 chaperonin GroEL [Solimonas aquatica]